MKKYKDFLRIKRLLENSNVDDSGEFVYIKKSMQQEDYPFILYNNRSVEGVVQP